jgi:ABC-type multidrug transport system ATPase subunit/ABC-type multidrug transport system permease subunit
MPNDNYIELNHKGKITRFLLQWFEHKLGRDETWADLCLPDNNQDWVALSRRHAILRKEGENYRIFDGDGITSSRNGIFINHKRIDRRQGYLLQSGVQLTIGLDPKKQVLLTYYNPNTSEQNVWSKRRYLNLANNTHWPVELGRNPSHPYASMELDAPMVSRHHAIINRTASHQYILKNLGVNGTFINGKPVYNPTLIQDNDIIRIGPFTLLFRYHSLELFDTGSEIRIDAHNLNRQVTIKGQSRTLIHNLSLAIEPGQLIAIVGGSGAGKSTLLKTLLGITPLNSGEIYLNGNNLKRNFNSYRTLIGYVPQDDIIHKDLTVEEVLIYACQLRLPPDINLSLTVQKILEQIQLTHVRDNRIQDLSGGQRKRVSIGVELLADPKLFFLDEPTSGLDPGLDKDLMLLLRDLADQGRTIILVTHATTNIAVCDRIAFMGLGGHLCYFGPPIEAMSFFQMPSSDLIYFPDIYRKLSTGKSTDKIQETVQQWENLFRQSNSFTQYIHEPLSKGNDSGNYSVSQGIKSGQQVSALHQLWILSQRYFTLVWRDRINLILLISIAPLGILFTWLALGETSITIERREVFYLQSPELETALLALKVLFIFTCATIWVGLSNSVRSIIQEKSIYTRERLVNLGIIPYLGSKIIVFSLLAIVQAFIITLIIFMTFVSPDNTMWLLGVFITTFFTLIGNVCLGLTISASVKNENWANSILPLIMLIQTIFAGVLFQVEGLAKFIANFMLSRWSIRAYGSLAKIQELTESSYLKDDFNIYANTGTNLLQSWLFLILLSLLFLGLSFWRLKIQKEY